jgi:tripartite-type tricarboxylate transporter receptor subunit TctC
MKEAALKDYEMTLWQGVFLPANTPPEIATFIEASVMKLLETPAIQEHLTKAGALIAPLPSARFTDMYLADIARWKKIIAAANIKLE